MGTLSLAVCHGMEHSRVLPLAKAAGFDGSFSDPQYGNDLTAMTALVQQGRALGLRIDNSHSTIPGSELLWADHPDAEKALGNFFLCIDNCRALGLPMLVVHCSPEYQPDFRLGIKRMERLVEYAQKQNVKIAFENTSSQEYLVKTLSHFEGCDSVGFCYDSGHEAFCTPGARFLPQIGHRLFYTHFSDNYLNGDHHLLPWDGYMDFERIIGELQDTGYQGVLALEVSYAPYQDQLSPEEYVRKCFDVSCRLARLLDR